MCVYEICIRAPKIAKKIIKKKITLTYNTDKMLETVLLHYRSQQK